MPPETGRRVVVMVVRVVVLDAVMELDLLLLLMLRLPARPSA